jgi:gas vesicle protein
MNHCESSFSGRTVVLSLFVGALAGAAAVLFLVPKARRESAERIRELSHDLTERASATIDTAKESISSAVSRGRDFLDDKRSVISSAVEAGKEAYSRTRAEVSSGGRLPPSRTNIAEGIGPDSPGTTAVHS